MRRSISIKLASSLAISGLFTSTAYAQTASSVCGNMTNITSTAAGFMIQVDGGVLPTSCIGSPAGWILIKQADQVMVSTALSHWLSNRKYACIYTLAYTPGSYCVAGQFDPIP